MNYINPTHTDFMGGNTGKNIALSVAFLGAAYLLYNHFSKKG